MSYELWLRFRRPVLRETLLEYLKGRPHYSSDGKAIAYENSDTGVHFTFRVKARRSLALQWLARELHFEINYGRPGYFAVEADIELRALLAAFDASVEDPQMRGMGSGPYSTEGFLRGWTYGNDFLTSTLIRDGSIGQRHLFPGKLLHDVWEWNYRRRERMAATDDGRFVPLIWLREIDGRDCLVTLWGNGMPTTLPQVDYVFVGKYVDGQERVGLATWAEVVDVVTRAGVDGSKRPIDIDYKHTPPAIAEWVEGVPLIDPRALPSLEPHQILDEEAVTGAESFAAERGGASVVTSSV